MNIEVKRTELLRALAAADGIARGNMPLLECVLIRATGKDVVTVSATNIEMTIRAQLASSNRKEGDIAINARRLRDVISHAPEETVTIAVTENAHADIRCGKAKYKLAGIAGRDFPKIAEPGKGKRLTIDADKLCTLIDRVLFSTSDDKTRMMLNAALFEVTKGVASMVTTDGHRLSRATCECALDADDFKALVPKEALAKMAKIATDEVRIVVESSRIFMQSGAVTFMSPLVEMPFPGIAPLLEGARPNEITVDRTALVASIERMKVATSETRGAAIDARNGVLVLSSSHPDIGEVSDEVPAEGATDKIASCCAPKYLLEPLARMTDDMVRVRFGGELEPFTIEGATASNYLALVMPMRRP